MDQKNCFPTWEEAEKKLEEVLRAGEWDTPCVIRKAAWELLKALPMPPTNIMIEDYHMVFVYLTMDGRHKLSIAIYVDGSFASVLMKQTKTGVVMCGSDRASSSVERPVELVKAFVDNHMRGENAIPTSEDDVWISEVLKQDISYNTEFLESDLSTHFANILKSLAIQPCSVSINDFEQDVLIRFSVGHTENIFKLKYDGRILWDKIGQDDVELKFHALELQQKVDQLRDDYLKFQKDAWLKKKIRVPDVTYVYADKLEQFRETAQETREDIEAEVKRLTDFLKDNPDLPITFTVDADYHSQDGNADLNSGKCEAVLGCKGWDRKMFYRSENPTMWELKDTIAYTLRGLPDNWRELPEETLLELYNNAIPWTPVICMQACS